MREVAVARVAEAIFLNGKGLAIRVESIRIGSRSLPGGSQAGAYRPGTLAQFRKLFVMK